MNPVSMPARRRNVLITPQFQVGIVLVIGAIIVIGGALFAWYVYRDARQALWNASIMGHYKFQTPYQIIGGSLTRYIAALFSGVFIASLIACFVLVRRIRNGIRCVAEAFRISEDGDLSTPMEVPSLKEFASFGRQVEAIRGYTLARIREVADDADFLMNEPLPPEEFRRRWDALKQKMGGIAP